MADNPLITQELIQQAKNGNAEAISIIYQTYLEPIYRYIAYRIDTQEDIDDLTMEVFHQMLHYLPKYKYTGAPFEAWLYRIAASQVAQFYRNSNRHPAQTELSDQISADTQPLETQLIDQQEQNRVRKAMVNLGKDDQEVLILRFVELKSHHEVATILGKTETAVRTIQHRALIRLANELGSEEKARHYLRGHDV